MLIALWLSRCESSTPQNTSSLSSAHLQFILFLFPYFLFLSGLRYEGKVPFLPEFGFSSFTPLFFIFAFSLHYWVVFRQRE